MRRVTGIGGVFFKASDPNNLREWYSKYLGITASDENGTVFEWCADKHPEQKGHTAWSIMSGSTRYFDPSKSPFILNYRVENLAWLLEQLRREGVKVDDKVEEYKYGKFGWIFVPEGNKIELWEPPKEFKWTGSIPME